MIVDALLSCYFFSYRGFIISNGQWREIGRGHVRGQSGGVGGVVALSLKILMAIFDLGLCIIVESCRRTCSLSSTTAGSTGALLPQTRQLRLQHLQSVQDVFDVRQLVVTATGLFGDVDTVSENNLVVAIDRVLHVFGALHVHRGALVLDTAPSRRVEVHSAEGGGGDVDVVDVVEHDRLIGMGESQVLLGFLGHQGLPPVADDQAGGGELD